MKQGEAEKWECDSISGRERREEMEGWRPDGEADGERRIEAPRAAFSAVWMAEQVHRSRNF